MRILAGKYKGKRFALPDSTTTRPTSQKLRQAVFNILGNHINLQNKIILDLFAGSGAFGFEAISLGAKFAYMVDIKTDIINKNTRLLNLQRYIKVIKTDLYYCKTLASILPIDFAFIDPPYNKGLVAKALRIIENGNYLAPKAIIVIETSSEAAATDTSFNHLLTKNYGKKSLIFLQR